MSTRLSVACHLGRHDRCSHKTRHPVTQVITSLCRCNCHNTKPRAHHGQ